MNEYEQYWNNTDWGTLKHWEKNTIQHGWQIVESVWNNGSMILIGVT